MRITAINNVTAANRVWILLFHCLGFGCGDHFGAVRFYKQTTFTHRNLYTEQLLCALLRREVCAQINFCTQTPLHTEAFTQITQKFLSTDALHKDAFARINKGTQALLNTEPFTRRNLCTEQLLHKETFTQENIDTEKTCQHRLHKEVFTHRNFYTQKLFQEQLLHNSFFPHRNLYAQKFPCTAVFTQTLLHTDAFTQKNNCTQACAHSALLHTANFYTQRLCFPFLITYLSCSPSQVSFISKNRTKVTWLWINTYRYSLLGDEHPFATYFDVHQGYKVLIHCHIKYIILCRFFVGFSSV